MTFRRWVIISTALIMVSDVAILLEMPVIRPFLSLVCFSTIPGLYILCALKIRGIGLLRKLLLSVGLSSSFLILVGVAINFILPSFGYRRPISTLPLVISFTLITIILGGIACWRNREPVSSGPAVTSPNKTSEGKLLWLLLLPFLFPPLAIAGDYLLSINGNSSLLLTLFILIPIYVILLAWQNKRVFPTTYPAAVWMMSLSILLSRSMFSDYFLGGDIYSEYHAFLTVLQNSQWIPSGYNYDSALSISLFPAILQLLTNISPLYIFKLILPLIISLVPLVMYLYCEKYVGSLLGFLSSVFFISQISFLNLLPSQLRIGVSLVTFSMLFLVILGEKMTDLQKRFLLVILIFCLVLDYYVIPVLFLLLVTMSWFIARIMRIRIPESLPVGLVTFLPFVLIFVWWGEITASGFIGYVSYSQNIVKHLSDLFSMDLRSTSINVLLGQTPDSSILGQVPYIIQRISVGFIIIGVLFTALNKEYRLKFSYYTVLMVSTLIILTFEVTLPWISYGYDPERLYIQLLIIVAPATVASGKLLAIIANQSSNYLLRLSEKARGRLALSFKPMNVELVAIILITGLLVSQFLSSSGLYRYLLGFPNSGLLDINNTQGLQINYIYDSDVASAQWLGANNPNGLPVYLGNILQAGTGEIFEFTKYSKAGSPNLMDRPFDVRGFFLTEYLPNNYILLSHQSVRDGIITIPVSKQFFVREIRPVSSIEQYLTNKSKIYDNSYAQIFR